MLELRNILNTKLNKKGFTLAELLVVVAILAILVAVSIPIFTGKLEKAREATDLANERSAKAVAVSAYLSEEMTEGQEYAYDAEKGVLVTDPASIEKYGQAGNHKDDYLLVKVTADSDASDASVVVRWSKDPVQ